jgi:hypothetical protein
MCDMPLPKILAAPRVPAMFKTLTSLRMRRSGLTQVSGTL